MIDDQDFSMEIEDPAPNDEPAVPPPPKVVIEYRDRGLFGSLLIPPLLILLSVLVILSSRRQTPILAPALTPVVSQSEPSTSVTPVAHAGGKPRPARVGNAPSTAMPLPLTDSTASVLPPLPDLDELMTRATSKASVDLLASRGREPGPMPLPRTEVGTTPGTDGPSSGPESQESATAPTGKVNKIERPIILEEPPPQPVAADAPPEVTKEQVLNDIRDEAARKGPRFASLKS